ncbi:MAG: uracil-DNA glycosylase [Chloroflexi bacterium]|nr:uracil-DNA glycosylase [Chloroflexota bacterium]MCI0888718.1 uracil-DNA glycosylase [Chloroflexota bacterium]
MTDLDSLAQAINGCVDCGLARSRTHAVPGEGSPQARLMFIGEGPGFNEDQQGRPFIGPAGQFLDELLASIGLARSEVFITNMVKCRPPNNRDPFPGEMEACSKYLDAQIEAIKPKVIVPLGRHALAKWFPGESIGKVRAKARRFGDITLFPLYHPAAALHNGALRSTILDDFAKLGDLLRAPAPVPEATSAEAAPAPAESGPQSEQLSMF